MRAKLTGAAILFLAALGVWLVMQGMASSAKDFAVRNRAGSREAATDAISDGDHGFRTKAAHRREMPARATHSPARLGDFILPPLEIEGLTLKESLEKLLAAYRDACLKSGETPLPLTFSVPPEATRRLRVHLKSQSFRTSVRMLATLAGMEANRSGLAYGFKPLRTGGQAVKETVSVSPDFSSILNEMAGTATVQSSHPLVDEHVSASRTIADCFAALGLELDPSTRFSLGASGKLTFESGSAADAAAITALVSLIDSVPKVQLKYNASIVDLKAGMDWLPPDLSQMDAAQKQQLMRDLAQRKGTELMTLPSATVRSGHHADIELIREFTYPTNDAGDAFETRDVGQVLRVQGDQLGFGQDFNFTYTDTTFDGFEPANAKKPLFNKRVDVANSGFANDGGTRFTIHTRPDGSKTLVMVTAQQLDPTGRPLR